MRLGREHPNVLAVDLTPVIDLLGVAKLDEGGQIARVVGVSVRGQVALDGHVAPELRYTVDSGRLHTQIRMLRLSTWLGAGGMRAPERPRSNPPYAPETPCSSPGGSDRDQCCPTRAVKYCLYHPAAPTPQIRCRSRRIRRGIHAVSHALVRNAACHSRTKTRMTSGLNRRRGLCGQTVAE